MGLFKKQNVDERITDLERELEYTREALNDMHAKLLETNILLGLTIKDLAKRHGWAMSNFDKTKKLKAELAKLKKELKK